MQIGEAINLAVAKDRYPRNYGWPKSWKLYCRFDGRLAVWDDIRFREIKLGDLPEDLPEDGYYMDEEDGNNDTHES